MTLQRLRLFALAATLLVFSYATPWSRSQDQSSTHPKDTVSTPVPQATTAPQTIPPQTTTAPPAATTPVGTSPSSTTTSKDGTTAPGSTTAGSATTGTATTPDASAAKDANPNDPTAPPAPGSDGADPSTVKHDGSKNDVDAIGNRKVGGRGMGNWYSLEGEIRMGKGYSQQVESSVKLIQDPVITEYVNRIGQNLVRNSDAQVPFTIKVVDSDEINAFALPGGFFYVNSGLILAADEEAELAGVMAHEIAHVAARHATRQMTRSQWANIGTIPLIFVGGGLGYAVRAAVGVGLPMTFLSFQRGFESEADFLGLQYMYKTGYDPQAFISFFEKIQAQEKKKPGTLAKAFSTHPQTPDRIDKSQQEIATILPAKPQYLVTTSEFDDVKSRLAAIENRRKVVDQKDANKPSLRRASTPDSTGTTGTDPDGTTTDDGQPTLKRRPDSN